MTPDEQMGQFITDQINADPEEVARLRRSRQQAREGRVVARIEPYQPGSHECCCGNPECTDFEDRMRDWGIPLDEITTVTYEQRLSHDDPA